MTKYLSPTTDFVFKKVFASIKNKDLTIELLNTILNKKDADRITHITLLDDANVPDALYKKSTTVDLRCKDKQGNEYIVEMQVAAEDSFFKRAQYYHAATIYRQLDTKELYETLLPVYFIGILNFKLFSSQIYSNFINTFALQHTITHETHPDTLGSYTFIELPKFTKEKNELTSHLDAWLNMFKRADKEHEVPEQFESYEAIIKAYALIASANLSETEWHAYQKELDAFRMEQGILLTAQRRGIEQGRAEGALKSKLEIAKQLLTMNIPLEQIASATGLDLLTIQELKNSKKV